MSVNWEAQGRECWHSAGSLIVFYSPGVPAYGLLLPTVRVGLSSSVNPQGNAQRWVSWVISNPVKAHQMSHASCETVESHRGVQHGMHLQLRGAFTAEGELQLREVTVTMVVLSPHGGINVGRANLT